MKTLTLHAFMYFCSTVFIALLTTNANSQWVQTGLTERGVLAFAASGSNLFAATDSGTFISTNNGTNWTEINNGLPRIWIGSMIVIGTDLYIGTAPEQTANVNGDVGDVYHSTNNGASWTKTGLSKGDVSTMFMSGTILFAGIDGNTGNQIGGVFASTNNGATWIAVSTGLKGKRVAAIAVSGTNIFAGTESGVNLSTNYGSSWTQPGNMTLSISSFAIIGGNIFAGSYGNGVGISTNNGANWNPASVPMLTTAYIQALAVSGTNLFATSGSGSAAGVFLSTNNGTSWSAINTGLPNDGKDGAGALAVIGSNLYSGPYIGGVSRRPLSDFGGSDVKTNASFPVMIELFPNPTSGVIHVRGLLSGEVDITISNVLGERLMKLTSVSPELSIDLTNFPGGVYYVNVSVGGTITTKMVVRQ